MRLSPVYLSCPALLSPIGDGLEVHTQALLSEPRPYLEKNDEIVKGIHYYFGQVHVPLRAFPETLPEIYRSRNNQLLWHALQTLEPKIEALKTRYGAGRIAVVLGTSTTGNEENKEALFTYYREGAFGKYRFSVEKQLFSSPADFVKEVYQLSGFAYTVSTACTSGARALMSAARLLRLGLCDAVICGGVDSLSTITAQGFHALQVLSTAECRPFSAKRSGINIGEAAALFVMTRHAEDGLPLLGYAGNSDAYHMSSPRPDALGATAVINQALAQANLAANQIQWVNLHGTGTIHNDVMEAKAVVQTLGQVAATSTKSMTGHTLGAAGALEAAFLWLAVSPQYNPDGVIPAHAYEAERDPALEAIHLTRRGEYFAKDQRRIALSTSFAFGGNNAAIIIGENTDV